MEVKLKLSVEEHKELVSYCNLNDLLISSVVKDSFTTGFNIERYGLLNSTSEVKEKIVEKEIIKRVEIPVEIEKEVIKIEYIEVEKPVEVVKEVVKIEYIEVEKPIEIIKETPVEKVVYVTDENEIKEKIFQKEQEFNKEKQELLSQINELQNKKPETIEIEKIKEVIIEKEVSGVDRTKFDALQQTVATLRKENLEKERLIKEYEKTIQEIQNFNDKQAMYLRGSNLDDKLYR